MKYDMRISKILGTDSVAIEVCTLRNGFWHPFTELIFYKATAGEIKSEFDRVCAEHTRVQGLIESIRA